MTSAPCRTRHYARWSDDTRIWPERAGEATLQAGPQEAEEGDVVMTHTEGKREPDADVRALDRLVGSWDIAGDATGSVTFSWLDSDVVIPVR
jgi:hypothetical protein